MAYFPLHLYHAAKLLSPSHRAPKKTMTCYEYPLGLKSTNCITHCVNKNSFQQVSTVPTMRKNITVESNAYIYIY